MNLTGELTPETTLASLTTILYQIQSAIVNSRLLLCVKKYGPQA
ncbi:hypothetical protein JCM19239_6990 [Vibrio variabilis]|uniref:Uncharacterized protein n=1 Tax=Vibrio variabilis TaxID=990271 RepID=A0ABQ0JQ81_9VIBR|nr:hypothetical protein JCM19239_6990 [Vibrio variabilis]